MTQIHVVYTKFDGSAHWRIPMLWLGEDEYGRWLGAPPNTEARRGNEPPVVHPQAWVALFPRDAWWTAICNAEPEPIEIYCDVTTVPQWREGEVTMVDLDLDVCRRRDGRVEVLDEDEFAEHQVRYRYPDEVVAAARAATESLSRALSENAEPFATVAQRWLAKVAR